MWCKFMITFIADVIHLTWNMDLDVTGESVQNCSLENCSNVRLPQDVLTGFQKWIGGSHYHVIQAGVTSYLVVMLVFGLVGNLLIVVPFIKSKKLRRATSNRSSRRCQHHQYKCRIPHYTDTSLVTTRVKFLLLIVQLCVCILDLWHAFFVSSVFQHVMCGCEQMSFDQITAKDVPKILSQKSHHCHFDHDVLAPCTEGRSKTCLPWRRSWTLLYNKRINREMGGIFRVLLWIPLYIHPYFCNTTLPCHHHLHDSE